MVSKQISMADIDLALKNLHTDVIDVMLLHSYDLAPLQQGDALAVLHEAVAAGKIRYFGYSGDNERAAWACAAGGIDVLECSISFVDQHNARSIVPQHPAVGVIAKRPVATAVWRYAGQDPQSVNEHHRDYLLRWQQLAYVASDYGCASIGELALRYTLSAGAHCAIASSTRPENVTANIAAAEAGPLPTEALERLQSVYDQARGDAVWLSGN
jgi:aryl-alcohol dehydrogenase-like predicted oxidoreductase